MKKVAVIGAGGFLGKQISKVFMLSNEFEVTEVFRNNYEAEKQKQDEYDLIVHSAMPSKRWWAANNPMGDFDATVRLTADILYNWKFKKLALISSISARIQTSHSYGRHKHVAEVLVLDHSENNLVFRLGGLYGEGLDKGVIYDMIEGNEVFMTSKSSFNYIDVATASQLIYAQIEKKGIIEVGAKDAISIGTIAEQFGLNVNFGTRLEEQFTENPQLNYPSAKEVLKFIQQIIDSKQ